MDCTHYEKLLYDNLKMALTCRFHLNMIRHSGLSVFLLERALFFIPAPTLLQLQAENLSVFGLRYYSKA